MSTNNYYEGVKHVVHIASNASKGCEFCAFPVGGENLLSLLTITSKSMAINFCILVQRQSAIIWEIPFT